MTLQVKALEKKSSGLDERKMEHALQLKQIVLDTEALKVKNVEVLKDKTNQQKDKTIQQAHQRKLETISFIAKSRQKGKDNDEKRKIVAKQKKFQTGSDSMGLLMGEIRKQTEVNGGCVPNPGTTPIPVVSVSFRCLIVCTILYCINYNPFTYMNR